MVISIDVKKALDKIQNIFVFSELGIEGNFFNLIKDFYQKKKKKKNPKNKKNPTSPPPTNPSANIILNGKNNKKTKRFLTNIRKETRIFLHTFAFQYHPESPS